MKKVNSIILLILLASCGGVKMKQEAKLISVCRDEWRVETDICTYNWYGFFETFEYSQSTKVKKSQVEYELDRQKRDATPVLDSIKSCY